MELEEIKIFRLVEPRTSTQTPCVLPFCSLFLCPLLDPNGEKVDQHVRFNILKIGLNPTVGLGDLVLGVDLRGLFFCLTEVRIRGDILLISLNLGLHVSFLKSRLKDQHLSCWQHRLIHMF
jgi:hypothetical protein